MPKKLAEKFTVLVDTMLKGMFILPEAKGIILSAKHIPIVQKQMEEIAREAARIAYQDCTNIAKLSQDQAYHHRDEANPSSNLYIALDGALGAFAGMTLTYQQFERVFCDGEEYNNETVSASMDSLISPTDTSPVEEHKLKDPRKK